MGGVKRFVTEYTVDREVFHRAEWFLQRKVEQNAINKLNFDVTLVI